MPDAYAETLSFPRSGAALLERPPLGGTRPMSGAHVALATGATYRQVDYWARAGVLVPPNQGAGSGNPRCYEPWQFRAAAALANVTRVMCGPRGLPSPTARAIVEAIERDPGAKSVTIADDALVLTVHVPDVDLRCDNGKDEM